MQEVGGGQRCPMQMSGLKGDETNLARRWTLTASKFPWSGRRGQQVGKQARRAGVKARSFLRMRMGGEEAEVAA